MVSGRLVEQGHRPSLVETKELPTRLSMSWVGCMNSANKTVRRIIVLLISKTFVSFFKYMYFYTHINIVCIIRMRGTFYHSYYMYVFSYILYTLQNLLNDYGKIKRASQLISFNLVMSATMCRHTSNASQHAVIYYFTIINIFHM